MATRNRRQQKTDNTLPIIDLLYLCLGNWHWYVASLFVTLTIAVLYILSTPPIYVSTASILIKDSNEKGGGGGNNAFTSFSDNYQSNANEELMAIQSPAIMLEAIKRLNLDINYTTEGHFHDAIIFNNDMPVKVNLLDIGRNEDAGFTMNLQENDEVCMWNFYKENSEISDGLIRARLNDTVTTPLGRICITPNENYPNGKSNNILVKRNNINKTLEYFTSHFNASFESENTTIANLRIRDISTRRGRAVLGNVIDIYNERWLQDKNQIAVSTDSFLNRRIDMLRDELWKLDGEIASYKGRNLIQNEKGDGSKYLNEKKESEKEILALTNQREVVQYLINILKDEKNLLLPGNIGLKNANVQSLITEYNTALLRRNSVAQNSSDENPIVKDYDNRLKKLKETIITAANNEVEAINAQIRLTRKIETSNTQALASNPEQTKKLQSIMRQQKVKNALYIFLLQKREENQLSKEYAASNTRIIAAPASIGTPVAPMKKNALMMAFAIGLLLPTVIIFLKEISNNKVRGRKDIESLTIPFVGEIPMYLPENAKEAKKRLNGTEEKNILVKEGSRDIINEAFRVLRTNIQFVAKKDGRCEVVILTSFNPGSGKTFLTMNIAASLSLKKEKVLVIDGDMRHGSSSAYVNSPSTGISNYLSGELIDIDKAVVQHREYPNLYILPVGTIPPNPTELLHGKRYGELIEQLRSEYDYILIDCPPIDIVADTQIIEEYADRTLFVVRTGLLERSMLNELEEIYETKRLKNLSIILNGTFSHGGYYKYGYRYGYRYSYRYGYRYGYHGEKKKK